MDASLRAHGVVVTRPGPARAWAWPPQPQLHTECAIADSAAPQHALELCHPLAYAYPLPIALGRAYTCPAPAPRTWWAPARQQYHDSTTCSTYTTAHLVGTMHLPSSTPAGQCSSTR